MLDNEFLFPAWAGVILPVQMVTELHNAFPRMGGGDPFMLAKFEDKDGFSPHGRG